MLQEYIPRSREISPHEAIFDNELVWWCTAPEDSDPPSPPPAEQDPPSDDPGADGGGDTGAPYCTTGARHFIAIVGSGSSATIEYHGHASFANNTGGDNLRKRIYWYLNGVRTIESNNGTNSGTSDSWSSTSNGQSNAQCRTDDNTWSWRGRFANLTQGGEENGALYYFKSGALAMTSSTPTSSDVEATTAGISCNFVPNARHSTATAKLEYKKTVDSTWIQAGSTADTNGFSQVGITRGITGLTNSTQYDFRLVLTRNSNNSTTHTSATASFTTEAGVATVSSVAATAVGITTATLRGSVVHNNEDGALSWRYHTSDPGTGDDTTGTEVSYGSNPVTGNTGTVSKGISSLTANTQYYFWAIYEPTISGTKIFGSVLNFTTQVDPGQQAADNDVLPIIRYDRKWGVATTLFFVVPQNAGSSSDLIYDGAAVWGAGETKITGIVYDDDSTPTITAEANTASNPSRVASTPVYRLNLSASEMQHDELYITLTNAGTSVRDISLYVRTHQMLGTVDVDASSKATNTTAVKYTGNGTGPAIDFIGGDGASMDIRGIMGEMVLLQGTNDNTGTDSTHVEFSNMTGVNTTADYYNGSIVMIVGGTGVGQSRVIIDYATTGIAEVDTAFAVTPNGTSILLVVAGSRAWNLKSGVTTGLASVPTEVSNYGDKLDLVFQRFAFKITQTATLQSWFDKDNSSWATRTVADNGTTQSIAKLA